MGGNKDDLLRANPRRLAWDGNDLVFLTGYYHLCGVRRGLAPTLRHCCAILVRNSDVE